MRNQRNQTKPNEIQKKPNRTKWDTKETKPSEIKKPNQARHQRNQTKRVNKETKPRQSTRNKHKTFKKRKNIYKAFGNIVSTLRYLLRIELSRTSLDIGKKREQSI